MDLREKLSEIDLADTGDLCQSLHIQVAIVIMLFQIFQSRLYPLLFQPGKISVLILGNHIVQKPIQPTEAIGLIPGLLKGVSPLDSLQVRQDLHTIADSEALQLRLGTITGKAQDDTLPAFLAVIAVSSTAGYKDDMSAV